MKTDTELQRDVVAELEWAPALHAAGVGVEVKDGWIELAGHVDSWAERDVAQHAAWGTAGVRSVIDNTIVVT